MSRVRQLLNGLIRRPKSASATSSIATCRTPLVSGQASVGVPHPLLGREKQEAATHSVTQNYEEVGKVYEKALFYAPGPYNTWLADEVTSALALQGGEALADVGGGTGSFTKELMDRAVDLRPLVIEPSTSMLVKARERGLATLLTDAAAFASSSKSQKIEDPAFDRVLLKEVAHHLDDRVNLFAGLRRHLRPGGRMLIVTRPKKDIDYPFFKAAKDVWIAHQPDPQEYVTEMLLAGFSNARVVDSWKAFPCSTSKVDWFSFIRNRGWSTFAHFDDAALQDGCNEIDLCFNGDDLKFEDRLVFVVGDVDALGPREPLAMPM